MLVELETIKENLAIATADTSQDEFLTNQIILISDTIEAYCRRVFTPTTYIQTFYRSDNPANSKLTMFHFPTISITSVLEDGVELDTADFRIQKIAGMLIKPCSYFFCADETVVTYVAGFGTLEAPAIPSMIQQAVISLVAERYNKKTSGVDLNFGSDVQRISIPGAISIDFDYSLSNNDRKTPFGLLLGSQLNVLDYFRSERSVIGSDTLTYLEVEEEEEEI